MNIGTVVVIDGALYEVKEFDPNGYVKVVALERSQERYPNGKWVDIYITQVYDPTRDGEALLDALSSLGKCEESDEKTSREVEATPDRNAGTGDPPGGTCIAFLYQARQAG
jgi:hypothetical protein